MGDLKFLLGVAAIVLGAGCSVLNMNGGDPEKSATEQESDSPFLTVARLRELYADADSRFMTIKGLDVHYKDEGKGPVLFMIHGSQSSLRTWDKITAALKDDYRIIRYDIPGYGLSGAIPDEAAARVAPEEVAEALLDSLGVGKVTAIGVSSGGTMAVYLAARRPGLVERLILSNTPADPVTTGHLVQPESFLAAQARAKANGYQDLDFWNQYLSYFSAVPERISAKTRGEYYDFNRRTPERHPVAMVARIGDGKDANVKMAAVSAPALLIWGAADPLLPSPASLERHLSNARVSRVVMEDVGHYPPLEAPERFARLIDAYVVSTPAD